MAEKAVMYDSASLTIFMNQKSPQHGGMPTVSAHCIADHGLTWPNNDVAPAVLESRAEKIFLEKLAMASLATRSGSIHCAKLPHPD